MTARPRDEDELDAALSVVPARARQALGATQPGALATPLSGADPAQPLRTAVLTRRQLAYCRARATGANRGQACAIAGVARRTAEYWHRRPELAAALNARIDQLHAAYLTELRRDAVNAAPIALARLRHIARRGSEGEARKASEYLLGLVGLHAPETGHQHDRGPRIVIERAVLALTSPQDPDPGTPQDRG